MPYNGSEIDWWIRYYLIIIIILHEKFFLVDKSLVAAILCGLGYNEMNRRPLYRAHDMVLNLDTELKMEELEMVSEIGRINELP